MAGLLQQATNMSLWVYSFLLYSQLDQWSHVPILYIALPPPATKLFSLVLYRRVQDRIQPPQPDICGLLPGCICLPSPKETALNQQPYDEVTLDYFLLPKRALGTYT